MANTTGSPPGCASDSMSAANSSETTEGSGSSQGSRGGEKSDAAAVHASTNLERSDGSLVAAVSVDDDVADSTGIPPTNVFKEIAGPSSAAEKPEAYAL